MTRILRCAGCARRIRPPHPHGGVEDLQTGGEFSYHARCQARAAEETAARMERGKAYVMHHYHSALCPDAAGGLGCAGGCFDTQKAAMEAAPREAFFGPPAVPRQVGSRRS